MGVWVSLDCVSLRISCDVRGNSFNQLITHYEPHIALLGGIRKKGVPEGYATSSGVQGQCNMQGAQASSEHPPHRKIDVTSKPPVGGISVVTLIRTDTTLDHSQKAEKV